MLPTVPRYTVNETGFRPNPLRHPQSICVEAHKLTTGVKKYSGSLRAQSPLKANEEAKGQVEELAAAHYSIPTFYPSSGGSRQQYKWERAPGEQVTTLPSVP